MLLTISAGQSDVLDNATDLGFLLHKHPDRMQRFDVYGGTAFVFYPEATTQRCTAALLVDIDPIALVRTGGRDRSGFALAHYINDRPYAASSLLSVAMGKVFRTALAGRCDSRPELTIHPLNLTVEIPSVLGGCDLVRRLFTPLGWTVEATPVALDTEHPEWDESPYVALRLSGSLRLADALNHVYVLLPVLDNAKHYWVGPDEVDKLIRAGGGWLASHPDRDIIARRFLAHQRWMQDEAIARLDEIDDRCTSTVDTHHEPQMRSLVSQRHEAILDIVTSTGAQRIIDLGCGQGALLERLLPIAGVNDIVGTEVSDAALQAAARRLHVDTMTERQQQRLTLRLSSLRYQDDALAGYDLAILMEVIEHIDPDHLPALAANVFGAMHPETVVITTPNADYNIRYPGLAAGGMRHPDHRFEWTRAEFSRWISDLTDRYDYSAKIHPVGEVDPDLGPPTQLAVLTRLTPAEVSKDFVSKEVYS